MQIWKYVMEEADCTFEMPKGAEVLSCQTQDDLPVIWALVDENAPKEKRHFVGLETGSGVDYPKNQLKFIDTVQASGIVNHVFEVLSQNQL